MLIEVVWRRVFVFNSLGCFFFDISFFDYLFIGWLINCLSKIILPVVNFYMTTENLIVKRILFDSCQVLNKVNN